MLTQLKFRARVEIYVVILIYLLLPNLLHSQTNRYDTLKAVLIVGPQEESTYPSIREMRRVDTLLRSKGIRVLTFYNEMATKEYVVKAMQGAHIVVYDGHGTTKGDSSESGGLYLYDGTLSSAEIRAKTRLGKNAVVLFQSVCHGAGSSADDVKDIGIKEAVSRVFAYADPFISAGAGDYYATNWNGGVYDFLQAYLINRKAKDIFLAGCENWNKSEGVHALIKRPGFEMGVASNPPGGERIVTSWVNGKKKTEKRPGFKEYNLAWVGKVN